MNAADQVRDDARTPTDRPRSALVVGGGLAGIACALRLADHGVRTTLLETRKKLGGRATSFDDRRTGLRIDNCQHVAMGCCTNFVALMRRLGAHDLIDWRPEVYWVERGGRQSRMTVGPLPAPGQYGLSMPRLSFLSMRERVALSRAMLAALRADRTAHTTRTFREWLDEHGQPPRLIERFWSPVIVSACNLDVDRVCAATALHVVQEGFLAARRSGVVGVPRVPLVELYDPARERLETLGGEVRLGASVARVRTGAVELADGRTLRADAVICATPFERALAIVDDELQRIDPRFEAMRRLAHSPILGVHLEFDRPVLRTPSAVLVGAGTQWLFRKDDEGRRVHAVISAADDWMALDENAIAQRVTDDVRAWMPDAAGAEVVSVRAVKEKRATFAPTPTGEASRPGTTGPSGVILAGCYVRTGWPSTMEGAVRSGEMAAAAALGLPDATFVSPPLRPGTLTRVLGGPSLRRQAAAAGAGAGRA